MGFLFFGSSPSLTTISLSTPSMLDLVWFMLKPYHHPPSMQAMCGNIQSLTQNPKPSPPSLLTLSSNHAEVSPIPTMQALSSHLLPLAELPSYPNPSTSPKPSHYSYSNPSSMPPSSLSLA